jgi:hypothetical protein
MYRNCFQALIDELKEKHQYTNAKVGQPQNWYSFSSGISGITFGAVFVQSGKARTEFYIDFGEGEKIRHYLIGYTIKETKFIPNWVKNSSGNALMTRGLHASGFTETDQFNLMKLN